MLLYIKSIRLFKVFASRIPNIIYGAIMRVNKNKKWQRYDNWTVENLTNIIFTTESIR